MTYQIIDNFAAGLDTRKSPLTSPPGTLTKLINAAITPGGEIAKRRAFVRVTFVSGSFGLAATEGKIYVYGKGVIPPGLTEAGIPLNVSGVYLCGQLIQNTDTTLRQTDFDIFAGRIYLACATTQNPVGQTQKTAEQLNPHYYDTNLTEGAGKGYYVRTYQTKVYSVLGQLLQFSAGNFPAIWDDETYIDRVVVTKLDKTSPIKVTVSTAEITQFVNGKAVLIQGATLAGLTGANGYRYIANVNAGAGTFDLVGTNGLSAAAAQTTGTMSATPAILVTQISNTNPARCTVPVADIGKFAEGMKVNIYLAASGATIPEAAGIHAITDINAGTSSFALAGVDASDKVLQTADTWATVTTDVVRLGRGYVNMSTMDSDSERLSSLEVYYDKLAIFSTKSAQIWSIDANPLQNSFDQVLRGAGTTAPRSPLMYGSGDVLYLDRSGIRSLKAKDSSNSAAVSDIGSPVDPTVQQYTKQFGSAYMSKAISVLEPDVGRFWVVFEDRILVLSYFPGPKITAWSEYILQEFIDLGVKVQHVVTCNGRIFIRDTADGLWVYGGVSGTVYNNPGVEVRLPYLDGKKPGHKKTFEAVDATVNGTIDNTTPPTGDWRIAISYDFNNPDVEETIATINKPTWNIGRHELQGYDSHFSLRFYNDDDKPATISNAAVHYNIADDEA